MKQEMSMDESKFYHISRAGGFVRLASLAEALAADKKDGFLWLDYSQATQEDLSVLVDPLKLHPLAIEDCLDDNQIPKIEDYPCHTFILFNAFIYSDQVLSIHELDLFIGENFLVSVRGKNGNNQEILTDVEHFIKLDLANAVQGPAFLAHILLDYVVDRKFVAIDALEEEIDATEDAILADRSGFNPGELVRLRRELLSLRKSLFHEREILVKICRGDCNFIPEKAILFYRDIYDHLAKFFELTESLRDLVTSLMEMHLSILNNQMTMTANETNQTVRRLTYITTIFMPLTLLAGIGGMSEWSMMTGAQNWRIAYPLFLLGLAVLGVATYFILKWFEQKRRKRS
jgi:magnesium transporter